MSNRDIALAYVRCFAQGDVDGLGALLADSLRFTGPLMQTESAEPYLKVMREHPLPRCRHKILSVTEDGNEVAVFYEYEKPEGTMTIAQRFTIEDGLITETHLVFDSATL